MNLSTIAVKSTAKAALKGNYSNSVVVCTLYIFAVLVCTVCYELSISVIGPVMSFMFLVLLLMFFIIPLTLGVIYFTVRMIFGQNAEPVIAFKYFSSRKDFKRAITFSFHFLGNALFTGFLLFIPPFLADLVANGKIFKLFGAQIPLWASGFSGISAVLKVVAALSLTVVMMKYYLAPFLFAANENTEPSETLRISKIISSVTKKDFILLILSFFWYILACFFMIPDIFIFPYFSASYCVHCRFCIASYNSTVDTFNQKEISSFEVTL